MQDDEKPILVMGATGGIGREVVRQGLARGLSIRALSRHADEMDPQEGLDRKTGNALDAQDMRAALHGCRAVIFALGIKESLDMLWKEVTLFSEATRVLLDTMPEAGVSRLVAVTGFGAGRSRDAMSTVERIGHRALLGKPYADKDRQEEMLMASDLDWTIARPVILTNGDAKSYTVLRAPETWRNGLIARRAVAAYCLDAVTGGLDLRADVVLTG